MSEYKKRIDLLISKKHSLLGPLPEKKKPKTGKSDTKQKTVVPEVVDLVPDVTTVPDTTPATV